MFLQRFLNSQKNLLKQINVKNNHVNTIIKKIFKIFIISFLGFYLPYLILIIFPFIQNTKSIEGEDLVDFTGASTLISIPAIIFASFAVVVLLTFSLIDKKVLNGWFIFCFAIYCFVLGFLNQQKSTLFLAIFIIISLILVLVVVNASRWMKKPRE